MKKLLLIRHAKATHDNGYIDFERPLKKSGIQDATVMAQRLHAKNIIPKLIISSPALRTIATADIFAQHLSVAAPVINEHIYDASEITLLHIIDQFPDQHEFVALVGHNPGIAEMLYYFTGKAKDVKPGAVALIHFEIDTWKEVSMNNGELMHYDEPALH